VEEMVRIAVIIPCLNEEATIAKVVTDFKRELPDARIIVVDNNSTDFTVHAAIAADAEVMIEYRRGKGYVMKSAMDKIDSDIYVFVDGDDTYAAKDVHKLLKPVLTKEADMCVGSRIADDRGAIKTLHVFGNGVIVWMINFCFGVKIIDALSGYRVLNRQLVQHLNLISSGFEIETELTIRTLLERFRIVEEPVSYKSRPVGSKSKLKSFSDGSIIFWTIITLLRDHRPMVFCSVIAGVFAFFSLVTSSLVLMILAIQFISMGFILHSIRGQTILLDQLIRRKR
jgi:glycosyltransferase involved in cell wall biosynthesis